jgi:hypothetical protein
MARSPEEIDRHPVPVRTGKTAEAGAPFYPAAPVTAAPGEGVEYDRPRPSSTRFPIEHAAFVALKEAATRGEAPTKLAVTAVQDRGRNKPELATAAASPAVTLAPGAPSATAPAALGNFAGITATNFIPPDCTLVAGPSHVLASVNATVAIYAKAGGPPVLQRTLTTWFANVISEAKIFDPKAVYDQHEGRWLLLAVALHRTQNRSWFLLSVSQTADPLGGWFNYALDATLDGTTPTNNWADYPCLGIDNQALYLTGNMFRFGDGFQYAKVRVIPKSGPYSGGAISFKDLVKLQNTDGSMAFTVQPCHTIGAPQVQYLVNSQFPTTGLPVQNRLTLWALTNPLTTATLVRSTVNTDPYGMPPDAEQKGGGTPLDTGDIRVLNAVFRGGSVWAAFTTQHDWGDGKNVAAAHWLQINPASGALVQQGIYGARGFSYFYPVVMPDTNGNMTMGFSRSGGSDFASIFYTGRRSTDPLGQLQPSALLKAGVANYVRLDSFGRNRWGDYNGIAIDPADGRTVWFSSEFADTGNNWATWIGSAQF